MNYTKKIKEFEKACGYKFNKFEREFSIYWIENGYEGLPEFSSELAMDFHAMLCGGC